MKTSISTHSKKQGKKSSNHPSSSSSSARTASPSPSVLKSRVNDPNIGTLWVMKNSPFSSVVKEVLHLSSRTAEYVTHVPIISSFVMYFRILFHGFIPPIKLTVPVLKPKHDYNVHQNEGELITENKSNTKFLLDSFIIAKYIDMNRFSNTPSLFPSKHLRSIASFNKHAQIIICYTRGVLFERLKNDLTSAEKLFAPKFLRGRKWITHPIIHLSLCFMQWKYKDETRMAGLEQTRRALSEIRAALIAHSGSDLRYLVGGGLTYADIVVAQTIGFDTERYPQFAHLYGDPVLADEFADVIAWARAVRETHCTRRSKSR